MANARIRLRLSAALFAAASLLAACGATGNAAPSGSAAASAGDQLKIAFLSQGASNEWAIQFDEVAKANVARQGLDAKLFYFDSGGNADKQIQDMEDALALHASVIVLYPMGAAALVGEVERAQQQGVPVILCAAPLGTDKYTSLVTIDWKARYTAAMEWLAKEMGYKGNVVMLDGQAGVSDSEEAGGAARAVLSKYPDIKIVGEGYTDWSIAKAKQLTETFIAKGVQIDGIYADGGEPTIGAVQAFVDAGKDVPMIAGTSAQNGALRVLKETGAKFYGIPSPPGASAGCIDVAGKLLKGEDVKKLYDVSEVLGLKDFFQADLDKLYKPQYADGYQDPTDTYLTQDQLKQFNLLRTQ